MLISDKSSKFKVLIFKQTPLIMLHSSNHKYLKHFYLNEICVRYRHSSSKPVSYNRFAELEKSVVVQFVIFVKKCLLGKCSLGWFYGFKLHLICNDKGEILNFMITPGDVDDREPLLTASFPRNRLAILSCALIEHLAQEAAPEHIFLTLYETDKNVVPLTEEVLSI